MVRSGELPARLLALHYGADLVWGPETVDRALIGSTLRRNPRANTLEWVRFPNNGKARHDDAPRADDDRASVIFRLDEAREKGRLIFQVGTADPDLAVQCCDMVGPYVAGVDVNSGCPKPFSTSGGMGAALLSTPDLLCAILERLVRDVGRKHEIGVSVKIRLLSAEADTRALVERLVRTGITGLTVHCRTRTMRKTERAIRAQLRMVGDVCRAAGVACLMNGDVEDRAQSEALAAEHGVDGGMLATAAEKDASVFRRAADGGRAPWPELLRRYMRYAIEVENRWGNTKFTLAQLAPGKLKDVKHISQMKNYADVCGSFGFAELEDAARALDARAGITERKTKSEQKAEARAQGQTQSKKRAAEGERGGAPPAKRARAEDVEGRREEENRATDALRVGKAAVPA